MMITKKGIGEEEVDRLIRAYPRVLRRGVIEALRKVEGAIEICKARGDAFQWLERYRQSKDSNLCVVPWFGLHQQMRPYVEKFDDALRALREYKKEDYTPENARQEFRRQTGELGGRPKLTDDAVIVAWLMQKQYSDSKNKKGIVIDAADELGVKKSKLLEVAKAAGMTKGRRIKAS